MKNLKWISFIGILIILSSSIVVGVGNGTPFDTSENDEIKMELIDESGETIIYSGEEIDNSPLEAEIQEVEKTEKDQNIMLWGKEIDITGEAKDLIMAAGAKITSKALGSYAFMGASELNISGEIFRDTFAMGNEIKVDGSIGRDFYALGNTIDIDGTVARDVYVGGEELSIRGHIGGDVKFAGESIYIASGATITGDMDLYASKIQIEEGAIIEGVVTYKSDVESISIPQNINTKINEVKKEEVVPTENPFISGLKSIIWWTVANSILFAVLMLIFKGTFEKIKNLYKEDTVQKYCSSCGWGLLSIVGIPFVSILCLFTFIGSTVGILGLLLYTVVYMIATIITGYAVMNSIIDKDMNCFLKGILGILIIEVLRRLPVIGGIIALIVNAIAFGTIMKLIKLSREKKEEKVIEVEKTTEE